MGVFILNFLVGFFRFLHMNMYATAQILVLKILLSAFIVIF